MKQTHVYEVRDTTDDELYYSMGLFLTVTEAKDWLLLIADTDVAITDHAYDEYERIEIHEIPIGPGSDSKCIYVMEREQSYDPLVDEYTWHTR